MRLIDFDFVWAQVNQHPYWSIDRQGSTLQNSKVTQHIARPCAMRFQPPLSRSECIPIANASQESGEFVVWVQSSFVGTVKIRLSSKVSSLMMPIVLASLSSDPDHLMLLPFSEVSKSMKHLFNVQSEIELPSMLVVDTENSGGMVLLMVSHF